MYYLIVNIKYYYIYSYYKAPSRGLMPCSADVHFRRSLHSLHAILESDHYASGCGKTSPDPLARYLCKGHARSRSAAESHLQLCPRRSG